MTIRSRIDFAVGLLPARLRAQMTPSRLAVLEEFIRFGIVGCCGFVVDTGIVYALRYQLGLYGAAMVSYVAAVTVTWLLNRLWTFKGRGSGKIHRQWALFALANMAGFVLNRGTYAVLVFYVPLCARQPVIAITAGMLLAMTSNFLLSRNLVFPAEAPAAPDQSRQPLGTDR